MNVDQLMVLLNGSTVLVFGLIWLGIVLFLRRKKSLVYLGFFTLFYIYLYKVLDYTLLQFQFQLLQLFLPGRLILQGFTPGENINVVPLLTLTSEDLKTSLLNILLFVPFGLGLPFITNFSMKKVVAAGALLSIVLELGQLLSGLVTKISFRVVDINDVIFNTVGAALGYLLFVGIVQLYRHLFDKAQTPTNPILRYIAERPQIDK